MRPVIFFTFLVLISSIISSCCTARKAENASSRSPATVTGPKAIIYKTKQDYSKLVSITLSDDKKTLESYPDIKDVYYNGNLAYPTLLHKGFLLDNRGISKNSVFIKLTYEEYSKLAKTPSPEELMKMVIDNNPFKIMYSCGSRPSYHDIEQELNLKIDAGDFSAFTKIK